MVYWNYVFGATVARSCQAAYKKLLKMNLVGKEYPIILFFCLMFFFWKISLTFNITVVFKKKGIFIFQYKCTLLKGTF